jgi:uncharacterized damage-inducible protein DinB
MEAAPLRYSQSVAKLSEDELTRTYREGSWTMRQLVHHVADIHLLNFLRIKKMLIEPDGVTTIINMDAWATTPDAVLAPVAYSLTMLEGINQRFLFLLQNLKEQDLEKSFYHPVRQMHFTMPQAIYMAVWHLEHHRGHIQLALGLTPQPFQY